MTSAPTAPTAVPTAPTVPSRRKIWRRRLLRISAIVVVAMLLFGGLGYWRLSSSLPRLDGELRLADLDAEVTVQRDGRGIPTIIADSRLDAALALGVLHGQDRFFQMDLLRRVSSGRLSSLLGKTPVEFDSRMRLHRLGPMAEKAAEMLPDDQRQVLEAYASGVNQGLASLGAPPPEYVLLRQSPVPWEVKDSLLVLLSMVHQLEPLDGEPKFAWTELRDKEATELFDFLVRKGSPWDAPLDDSQLPAPAIPSAEVFSLRDRPQTAPLQQAAQTFPRASHRLDEVLSLRPHDPQWEVGSNAWAVAGTLTSSGHAILANDMHLGLRVPATWYQAAIESPMLDGTTRRLVGATLPGMPLIAVGSNGKVAWGVTAARAVVGDLVELKPVAGEAEMYQTPLGPRKLDAYSEQIDIAGSDAKTIEYQWSQWGPVVLNENGKRYAYRCVIHDPRAVDLNMLHLETASTVEEAMQIANTSGAPRLNCIAADALGKVGWTLAGRLPRRVAPAQPAAVDWSVVDNNWSELLPPEEYPHVIAPERGRVWNGNDRSLGQEYLDLMGYGDLAFGARSKQIRDRLLAQESFDEAALQAIQLDDDALYMQYWRKLLLETAASTAQPLSVECVAAVEQWGGEAAIDSIGYRIVSDFRKNVFEAIFGFHARLDGRPIPTGTLADHLKLKAGWLDMHYDDVAHDLIAARPMHWLPETYANWDELLVEAARVTEQRLTAEQSLQQATWGQVNTTAIQHPLSKALPWVSGWLDMPARQVPGDNHMPRVQGSAFGASQRLVVSPGREKEGIYHQPGGASGHFLSPFYRTGYEDWVDGTASPLLPGEAEHELKLLPRE